MSQRATLAAYDKRGDDEQRHEQPEDQGMHDKELGTGAGGQMGERDAQMVEHSEDCAPQREVDHEYEDRGRIGPGGENAGREIGP